MFKVVILCVASLAVCAHAGITHLTPAIATYSSAPSVSYSHFTSPALATHAAIPVVSTYSSPAVGTTHQSTVRSFDGTVTHHSKAVDTAFSSVRKSDTRVSNNVYAAAPAALTATTYHAAAPSAAIAYHAAAPSAAIAYHAAAAPAALTTTHYAAAAPAASILTAAPAHAVHYSAAPLVAHVSFDGLGTHYAF